jgi:hypothetical protein
VDVGGEDLTNFIALMLCSPKSGESKDAEDGDGDDDADSAGEAHRLYAQLPPRKRLQLARAVKEEHAYVAADFDAAVSEYGEVKQEWHRVAGAASGVTGERKVTTQPTACRMLCRMLCRMR